MYPYQGEQREFRRFVHLLHPASQIVNNRIYILLKIAENFQLIVTLAVLRCEVIFRLVRALVSAMARAAAGEPAGAQQCFYIILPVLKASQLLKEPAVSARVERAVRI